MADRSSAAVSAGPFSRLGGVGLALSGAPLLGTLRHLLRTLDKPAFEPRPFPVSSFSARVVEQRGSLRRVSVVASVEFAPEAQSVEATAA